MVRIGQYQLRVAPHGRNDTTFPRLHFADRSEGEEPNTIYLGENARELIAAALHRSELATLQRLPDLSAVDLAQYLRERTAREVCESYAAQTILDGDILPQIQNMGELGHGELPASVATPAMEPEELRRFLASHHLKEKDIAESPMPLAERAWRL